mmetsp:Transcript_57545/g.171250  ORF Transcript_57545/g.171250 Transcript_57545/m.171250 type:complete len:252 (-) Transcript_57545:20-775(-)
MQRLISIALLVALVPAASALDDSALVQATTLVRDTSLEAKSEDKEGVAPGDLVRYGELLNLTVRPAYGPELSFGFRRAMRLQVLMHTLSAKLGLKLSSATFTHKGRELDPKSTAAAFGVADKDVIEVSTPRLAANAAKAEELAAKLEKRHARQEEEDRREAVRTEKRRKVAMRVSKVATEQKRKHNLELKDEITLKFINPVGGADVTLAVKRNNWLEGYLELVSTRMGVDRSKTRFLFKDHGPVSSRSRGP